jgi:CRP/FNR family transcriptional regulator
MLKVPCGLDNCFLCQHCIPEWKELIAIKKSTFVVKKGKPIFQIGEKVKGIFFIYSGAAKIHAPWGDNKELIIRFATAGDIAGHRGLQTSHRGLQTATREPSTHNSEPRKPSTHNPEPPDQTYPVSATALEDTTVCFIPNEFWEASLKANPSLTYTLVQFYATELQKAEHRMRNLTHQEVKGRIADALLDISRTFGFKKDQFLAITLTRQDIASYAGTTYETVFKFFTELIEKKIITTEGKNIKINQPEMLAAYVK